MIEDFAGYRRNQLDSGKFNFIRATAVFKDRNTLALSDGRTLTARNFVIATGSKIAPAPLPQLDSLDCINSDSALSLNGCLVL